MEITLLYQGNKEAKQQKNTKSWDQQNYLVVKGFRYIKRALYKKVPLYRIACIQNFYTILPSVLLEQTLILNSCYMKLKWDIYTNLNIVHVLHSVCQESV